MTRQEKAQPVASARPRRTPLGKRNRLSIQNQEEGYVYRIVNDVDGRIGELEERGYEIVPKEKIGMVGDKRVDSASAPGSSSYISVGQNVKATVMRIRKEWFDEDQAIKQQAVADTEQTMKSDKSDYGQVKLS